MILYWLSATTYCILRIMTYALNVACLLLYCTFIILNVYDNLYIQ